MTVTGGREVFKLESSKGRMAAVSSLNGRGSRAIPISILLLLTVLASAGSGIYAGASFFPQQASDLTVTTTIYTTTTSWTTSTVWSTVTSVVQGVLTTVVYTTSTSTRTVTAGTSTSSSASTTSVRTGTTIIITQLMGRLGFVSISGVLSDNTGRGLAGMSVRIVIDGTSVATVTTGSTGTFTYSGVGQATGTGTHTVTVFFDGTSTYAPSQASGTYRA